MLVVRVSLGTLSVWTDTRRGGTLPRMGSFCCEPQRKFVTGSRIRDPGDRTQFILPRCVFAYGRAILCWEKEVPGFRQSAINPSIDGG